MANLLLLADEQWTVFEPLMSRDQLDPSGRKIS